MQPLEDLPKNLEVKNFVNGQWVESKDVQDVISPYTGKSCGKVHYANKETISEAIEKASVAQKAWEEMPLKARTQVLLAFRENLLKNLSEIASVVSAESGKTLAESRAGIM